MRVLISRFSIAGALCFMLGLPGCSNDSNSGPITALPPEIAHVADAHPSEGPHHGQLIELGKEEYHAELVHDDSSHTTTIYLFDAEAKSPVQIEAKELTLNLLSAGKPQQFRLAAQPEATDPAGTSSAFSSKSEELCEALDANGTTGRLSVEIQGKAFVGTIAQHAHDHDHKHR